MRVTYTYDPGPAKYTHNPLPYPVAMIYDVGPNAGKYLPVQPPADEPVIVPVEPLVRNDKERVENDDKSL